MKTIILDTETTDLIRKGRPLAQQPYVIEIGALYIDNDGKVTKAISQLINIGMPLPKPEMNLKTSGLTDKLLIDQPTFTEFLPVLCSFFEGADNLIAHNAKFDTDIIKIALERFAPACVFPWPKNIICTVQEYNHVMGKWPKLIELYEKIIGKPLEQTHRALGDCRALHEILVKDDFYGKIK